MHLPVLFLQGTKDSFCPLDELKKVQAQMKAHSDLHVVETGNHSLEVMKSWSKKYVSLRLAIWSPPL
jgi:pimeloyl-ACP methyl ester carboxylesterase